MSRLLRTLEDRESGGEGRRSGRGGGGYGGLSRHNSGSRECLRDDMGNPLQVSAPFSS